MAGRTRAEILIGKALRDAAEASLQRLVILGDATVPEQQGMAVARQLTRAWTMAIKRESLAVQRGVGEVKAEDDLWQQFVREYIRLYGGQAIAEILETTRKQIVERLESGLREGKGVSEIAKEIQDAIPQLTRRRAAIIARTETHSAAQYASLETAKRYPFKVNKVWSSNFDHRTRDFGEGDGKADQANHRKMNGVAVAIDEPFMVPNKWGGFDPMMFPGDQTAPAYQCINCFHPDTLVSTAGLNGGVMRHYAGNMVNLSLAGPVNLTVTPNHPILTNRGWVPAGFIVKGDKLIYCGIADGWKNRASADIKDGYSLAHQLYASGDKVCSLGGSGGVVMDFHGEMVTEQVNVVSFNSRLRDGFEALGNQLFGQLHLAHADIIAGDLLAERMTNLRMIMPAKLADSFVSGGGAGSSLALSEHGGCAPVSLGDIGLLNAQLIQDGSHHCARQVEGFGNTVDGVTAVKKIGGGGVVAFPDDAPSGLHIPFEFRECSSVETFHYSGPVYNFESDTGILVANGIVNHNCRCAMTYRRVGRLVAV